MAPTWSLQNPGGAYESTHCTNSFHFSACLETYMLEKNVYRLSHMVNERINKSRLKD